MNSTVTSIISGGQTGADRAALDWAISNGIPHGGWCAKGRRAEDGPIDNRYQLRETPSDNYIQRTEWNVRDSDGTVVFSVAAVLTGGSQKTVDLAQKHGKPCLHLSAQSDGDKAPGLLREFIRQHGIKVLNVAGPRGSKEPEITGFDGAFISHHISSSHLTSALSVINPKNHPPHLTQPDRSLPLLSRTLT